jgi:hypothetical protein
MTKAKLLKAARNHPHNLRFEELCQLAEAYGFEWVHEGRTESMHARE